MRVVSSNDVPVVSTDPLSPGNGNFWYNSTDDQLKLFDGSATRIIPFKPLFGDNFEYSESLGQSTNNTTTLVDKINYTTAVLPVGIYAVHWYYEWAFNSTANSFVSSLLVDSVTYGGHVQEPQDPGATQRHPVSGFCFVNKASATTSTIQLRFAKSGGAGGVISYIFNARVMMYRVANI